MQTSLAWLLPSVWTAVRSGYDWLNLEHCCPSSQPDYPRYHIYPAFSLPEFSTRFIASSIWLARALQHCQATTMELLPRRKRQPRTLNYDSCSFCRNAKVKVSQVGRRLKMKLRKHSVYPVVTPGPKRNAFVVERGTWPALRPNEKVIQLFLRVTPVLEKRVLLKLPLRRAWQTPMIIITTKPGRLSLIQGPAPHPPHLVPTPRRHWHTHRTHHSLRLCPRHTPTTTLSPAATSTPLVATAASLRVDDCR
jgi:hypothetical protein